MAYEHLKDSLTKGNLWVYILSVLQERPSTPVELKAAVRQKHGFSPATITFYSVIYKLQREGLVKRASDSFRSSYEITPKGAGELAKAREILSEVTRRLGG